MNFKLSLLILIFILPSVNASDFDKFDNLVHIIKVKSKKGGSHTASGTGFVIGKNGKLITNYHVISKLFKKGKINDKYKIYVKIGKKEFLAKILKIDILSDLALIEIPHKFKSTVSIASREIGKGEKIYSLGYHDKEFLAINQGTFSDYIIDQANNLMALSIPLNRGMSGGPILNTRFKVIGVNVMKNTDRESSGYGINRKKLIKFIKESEDLDPNVSLEEILSKQVSETYGRVIASINNTKDHQDLNNWKTPDMEHFLYCGEFDDDENFNNDVDDKDKDQILAKYKVCQMDYRKVPLAAMGSDIKISYAIVNFKGSQNTRPVTYYNYINNQFKFEKFKNIFQNDKFSCKKDHIENSHGVSFKLSICAFKYERVPSYIKDKNYYKFDVKSITMNPELDDILINLQFSGEPHLAKSIIKSVLENIYKIKKDRTIAQDE